MGKLPFAARAVIVMVMLLRWSPQNIVDIDGCPATLFRSSEAGFEGRWSTTRSLYGSGDASYHTCKIIAGLVAHR